MISQIFKLLYSLVIISTLFNACYTANALPTLDTPSASNTPSPAYPIPTHPQPTPTIKRMAVQTGETAESTESFFPEAAVQLIPLDDLLSSPGAEISGMAWHNDRLLILPQYPEKFLTASGFPCLFAVEKAGILAYLKGENNRALAVSQIPIRGTKVAEQLPGYEGFEAIAIHGGQVYLTIEVNDFGTMRGYLIQGALQIDGNEIEINPESLMELAPPVQLFNAAFESLVANDGQVLALFEANGEDLNPGPVAYQIDPLTGNIASLRISRTEYRITDATGIDPDDRFWVLNVFVPIEFWFFTNSDPLAEQFGLGKTHQANNHVERLVELKYNDGQITLSGKPPLYIELIDDANPRNWEAIVRLDEQGFLAMTDTYPGTILGYIPYPEYSLLKE